jgi:hypothetical protein
LDVDGRTLNATDLILSRKALDKGPGPALIVQISDGGLSQILNQP